MQAQSSSEEERAPSPPAAANATDEVKSVKRLRRMTTSEKRRRKRLRLQSQQQQQQQHQEQPGEATTSQEPAPPIAPAPPRPSGKKKKKKNNKKPYRGKNKKSGVKARARREQHAIAVQCIPNYVANILAAREREAQAIRLRAAEEAAARPSTVAVPLPSLAIHDVLSPREPVELTEADVERLRAQNANAPTAYAQRDGQRMLMQGLLTEVVQEGVRHKPTRPSPAICCGEGAHRRGGDPERDLRRQQELYASSADPQERLFGPEDSSDQDDDDDNDDDYGYDDDDDDGQTEAA